MFLPLLLIKVSDQTYVKGMKENEKNHHFATCSEIIGSGNQHQWMLKSLGVSLLKNRICT